MPKRVDHDVRRRAIADALLRVAAERGLHHAGFREVAAEAGVSVRLVQYYFETKEQLLLFGLRRVGEQFGARVLAGLAARDASTAPAGSVDAAATPSARERIEFVLSATMPLDDDSRSLYLVYNQYFALALTDSALAAQPYSDDPDALRVWLLGQLRACQDQGLLAPETDAADETTTLLALTVGLGNAVLAGRQSAADARRLLARHLDQRLPPAAAAATVVVGSGGGGSPSRSVSEGDLGQDAAQPGR